MARPAPSAPPARPRRPWWSAGIEAARANLVPGLLIQAAMLAVLIAYYCCPPARAVFDTVAAWKTQYGYCFTIVVTAFAGAILPELLRVAVFQRGAFKNKNLQNLLFTIPFWSLMGMCVDAFYRGQTAWFGPEVSAMVLLKKISVDQFIYTPLFGTPATVWAFEWKKRNFSFRAMADAFGPAYIESSMLPAQVASWAIWIPGVLIIYSLPLPLQIPLFALGECFWSLLIAYIMLQRPALDEHPPLREPEAGEPAPV